MVSRSGGVEVDHQADAAAGHPDADAGLLVPGVHEVPIVTAVVRPLALEVQVGTENGRVRIAETAAEVLAPAIAGVSGPARRSPGLPPTKCEQMPRVASSFAYGRETLLLMPESRASGATARPPGEEQLPFEVTQPPVRVQFISRR